MTLRRYHWGIGVAVLGAGWAGAAAAQEVRVASFNVSLHREALGELRADLEAGDDPQIARIAEIIQRVRPDILLLNEFDFAASALDGVSDLDLFQENYLAVPQDTAGLGPAEPITYEHDVVDAVNTGIDSGYDLDNNGEAVTTPGEAGYAEDAFGYGDFPGQFGMSILSRHPVETRDVRTFQSFLWKDMPGALLPADPEDADGDGDTLHWFTIDELEAVRLSSKSHWDVPVTVGEGTLHLLASHPTPPAFDGPEERNLRRNHDEIRFWADYIDDSAYIYDDNGDRGGLPDDAAFVILGDLNADPVDGTPAPDARGSGLAIADLLDHPRVADPAPTAPGGADAATADGPPNDAQSGDPAADTADFSDGVGQAGNLRVDYALPSADLEVVGAGVYWPATDDAAAALLDASDHRLVWVDLVIPPAE